MRPGEEALYAVEYGADPDDPRWGPGHPDLVAAANAPKPWTAGDSEWVYFIQAGEGGPIKIGVARNPSTRLKALRTGAHAPLTLLGAVQGGYDFEAQLHEEFREQHRHGEWFEPTPALLERIAELTSVS